MPESVTDRCTKSHEYIFLLSKSAKYFYDHEAVKEKSVDPESFTGRRKRNAGKMDSVDAKNYKMHGSVKDGVLKFGQTYETRNKRSVWTVSTKPFSKAHFATFPPKLIEPCILAGCPKGGVIIDPFMGGGTTAIVSYKHDRKFIGCELSKKYLDEITIPRIENETKQMRLFA